MDRNVRKYQYGNLWLMKSALIGYCVSDHLNTKEPYVFFITSLYLITGLFMGANFKQYETNGKSEAVIVIMTIIIGKLILCFTITRSFYYLI